MATGVLWRIAMRLFHSPSNKSAGAHMELMSNTDLDHWLEERGLA
jgi:hypothetical protein